MATNENLIPIPGRLHSVATEGHVAGADEIFDDSLNKDQATINSELSQAVGTGGSVDSRIAEAVNVEKTRAEGAEEALDGRVDTLEEAVGSGGSVDERIEEAVAPKANSADVYAKTETYNKTELNNMITTPNQEYVPVTATAQTTAVTDVLPATGAADTTYRVGNWDGTQYNDSVFSEYAWNGSAYIKLSTKSQIGEVYDISANHADTKYADLAAALGTNGANIPQSLRKGGMSIKFVQSSDNKYVQYRYMSTSTAVADFTNEDNWQGIDDEPTAASKNLVKSGGISSAIYNIDRELHGSDVEEHSGFPGYNGWNFEEQGNSHIVVRVTPRNVVSIFNGSANTYFYVLKSYSVPVDSSSSIDFCSSINSRQQAPQTFTVPDDANYIVVSKMLGDVDHSPSSIIIDGEPYNVGVIPSVRESITKLSNKIFKTFDVNKFYVAGEFVTNPDDGKTYKLLQNHEINVSINSIKKIEVPLELISAEISTIASQFGNEYSEFNSSLLAFTKASINSFGFYEESTNWIAGLIPISGSIIDTFSIQLTNNLRGYLCKHKKDGTFTRTELIVNSIHEIVADENIDYYFSLRYSNTDEIDVYNCAALKIQITPRSSSVSRYVNKYGKDFNSLSLWHDGIISYDGIFELDSRFIITHLIRSCSASKLNIHLDSNYSGYIAYFNESGTFVRRDTLPNSDSIDINYPFFVITFKKTDNTNITPATAYSNILMSFKDIPYVFVDKAEQSFATSPRNVIDFYNDDWKFSWVTGTGIPTKRVYPNVNQLSNPYAITVKKGTTFKVKSGYNFKIYIIDNKWNIKTFTGWITTGSYTFAEDSIILFSIVNSSVVLDTYDNLANACLISWTYEDEIVNKPLLTSVPNPFFFEAMDCVEKLENECDEKSIVIGFVTDSHYNGSHTYNDNLAKYWGETAKNIKLVNSLYPMDMIVHGGDITDGYWVKADTISLLKDVRDSLMGIGPMNPIMLGNHDSNYPDSIEPSQVASRLITKGEFYSRMSRYIETKVVRVENKMYYYIDFDTIKLRFIFLDANITPNLYNMSDRRSWGYDTDQISWVQNTALDTNYQVVFFSHMGVSPEFNELDGSDSWPVNGTSLRNVIEAFISNGGVVVGFFHGHTHWDFIGKHSVSNGFYEISTCCQKVYDNATWNVEYLEEHYSYVVPEGLTIPTRIGGEVSQDCWDIIVIHPNSRKVKIIRFGAGNDREISY